MAGFYYSVLRYVPNAVRGEFINIGAIVTTQEEPLDWRWKFTNDWSRAEQLDAELLPKIKEYLGTVGEDVHEWLNEGGLKNLRCLWRNSVQLKEPSPMVADSLEEALDWGMKTFVD